MTAGRTQQRMRTDLTAAMKARNKPVIAALRSALAAIDNAGAIDASAAPRPTAGPIAGAVQGLHAAEVARRELAEGDVLRIIEVEIGERRAAADEYAARGRLDHDARLRAEADLLAQYLE